ncbi:MAG: tetratricopeptide repeat protein [Sphingomonadales bacterium]|nr:tetratricopeptide repeat protein [Sphingomonadales bacterium]NCQ22157.1 tetratricopeptide repeat protein [Sphingomonadales bacterium]NCT03360.1 tetratricopeptide repeat protein [Sphingomonadales bacterium]
MTPLLRNPASKILPLRLAGAMLMGAGAATMIAVSVPAAAQDTSAEARIRKVEAEVRALQRKVFPGGDGRFFEPQIAPGTTAQPATTVQPSAPTTTAVTDILVRLDALETQLRALTARSEEQANALSQMEMRLATLETAANAPLTTPSASGFPAQSVATLPAPATAAPAVRQPAQNPPTPAPAVAAPSATRLAAVQAIAKPQTTDAGDDEYSYGFRLWNAGFFPEARQQLTRFVEQYPSHARISFGRNLLGRAFLDDNMPDEAARWFLKNYQANKAGDRAPDSLLYLGASMIALNDTRKACIALAEFAETYPLVATGRLADEYRVNLAKVTCN